MLDVGDAAAEAASAAAVTDLDDAAFEQIVLDNLAPRTRNSRVWEALLSAAAVRRTHAVLVAALHRNNAEIDRRRDRVSNLTQDNAIAEETAEELRIQHQQWQRRAKSFSMLAQQVLTEVNAARGRIGVEGDRRSAVRHREKLRRLAAGVVEHQRASLAAGIVAEGHDLALWAVLDSLNVPHGPDDVVSLRSLAAGHARQPGPGTDDEGDAR